MKQEYKVKTSSYDMYFGYQTKETSFETYDEAVAEAKKTAAKSKEDVAIWKIDSVVKFPVMDLEVQKLD